MLPTYIQFKRHASETPILVHFVSEDVPTTTLKNGFGRGYTESGGVERRAGYGDNRERKRRLHRKRGSSGGRYGDIRDSVTRGEERRRRRRRRRRNGPCTGACTIAQMGSKR